jgi:nucleotide-binding universal stress UspA family protein
MQKILVPVDFSSFSYNALSVAADIARKAQAEIHMLHIITKSEEESNTEINKKFLEIFQLKSLAGLKLVDAVKVNTSIAQAVAEYSAKNNIDLIAMGSHGERSIRDEVYGSNTDKIMKSSLLPLLIVKESTPHFELNTLVFCSNFFSEANLSFKRAKSFIELYRPEIHLLKVITPDRFESTAYSLQLMRDFANYNNLSGYTCKIINANSVEEGINYYCNEATPELLMIETHGRSALSHLLFGSVSEDIVAKRKQPVLTLKIEDVSTAQDVIFPS